MKKVGLRELKNHFSQYLQEVKKGKDILVTDRGKAIARIVPVRINEKEKDTRSVLLEIAREGYILLPQQWGKPMAHPNRFKIKGNQFSDAVVENRR
ncbi:MAG: type II toxin-antitoxin system Phd/YefM family antitoxin [bacterium]